MAQTIAIQETEAMTTSVDMPTMILLIAVSLAPCPEVVAENSSTAQRRSSGGVAAADGGIVIGIEYVMPTVAKAYAELGVPAAKHLPDPVSWGKMQRSKGASIDFSKMDRFVREYQDAGFRELMIGLKSQSVWASKNARTNFTPKPQFMSLYEDWIRSVVERYDADGKDDMPGMRWPVRYFEIGTEFSTYEPEPVDEYLAMLERAHRAAHAASARAIVLHAAFLVTTAFRTRPGPQNYEAAFAAAPKRILHHGLDDIRALLARPDLFDALNFHALGDPYEIEETVAWLRYETRHWRRPKPIIISDTAPNPLIGWGPGTRADGNAARLGVIIPPSTEADRHRLAAFLAKLVAADQTALEWTHSFVAADMVKKVVIAAEQGVGLINTSFTEDMPMFKAKLFQAAAGISPWGGMADVRFNVLTGVRSVNAYRPSFYAIQQLQTHIKGCDVVERVRTSNGRVRLYKLAGHGRGLQIAWFEPGRISLPGEPLPTTMFTIRTTANNVTLEQMIHRAKQTMPDSQVVHVENGNARIKLSPRPMYILRKE